MLFAASEDDAGDGTALCGDAADTPPDAADEAPVGSAIDDRELEAVDEHVEVDGMDGAEEASAGSAPLLAPPLPPPPPPPPPPPLPTPFALPLPNRCHQ